MYILALADACDTLAYAPGEHSLPTVREAGGHSSASATFREDTHFTTSNDGTEGGLVSRVLSRIDLSMLR